jgi:hypothetical protein
LGAVWGGWGILIPDSPEVPMTGETKKLWMEFCEQAAQQQDPKKLIATSQRNQSPFAREGRSPEQ